MAHPSYPAVWISWEEALEFVELLNQLTGADRFRLPLDTEWESAVRAGTTSRWFFGDDESLLGDYAWYRGNTVDVGESYAQHLFAVRGGLARFDGESWRVYETRASG